MRGILVANIWDGLTFKYWLKVRGMGRFCGSHPETLYRHDLKFDQMSLSDFGACDWTFLWEYFAISTKRVSPRPGLIPLNVKTSITSSGRLTSRGEMENQPNRVGNTAVTALIFGSPRIVIKQVSDVLFVRVNFPNDIYVITVTCSVANHLEWTSRGISP